MRTFFDSSSFAKRYIDEAGSEIVDEICQQTSELGLGIICVPEIISALNRRLREKGLSRRAYQTTKRALATDVRDAVIVNLTSSVISSCTTILESNPIRAMDALHVACALEWEADLFVSSDSRQIKAARKAGLRTRMV